jgi:hypothetical protein
MEEALSEIAQLRKTVALYEEDGPAKLFYALSRKAVEIANTLNSINLMSLDIDDPKAKGFERVITLLKNSTDIATAVKTLGEIAGVTGDEVKDVKRRTSPESIADVLENRNGN